MVLEVNDVSKTLSKRRVLSNVSFSVEKGEILGFIGPNGAGKTTAIKVILGLLRSDSGSVKIFGHDIAKDRVRALSGVGAIIESPELYTFMSGYDNLMQFARIHGVSKERVLETANLVGLGSRINDKVSKYSLGMRQRLGVAQAIMHDPGLLILDEPTNGLDPDGILELRNTLKTLAAAGKSILISSHLLSELEHLCTSVCIIEKGVIVSRRSLEDSPDESEKNIVYIINTGDNSFALSVLDGKYEACIADGAINVKTPRAGIPGVIKSLVSSGCDLYGVYEKKQTIEDAYLEATSGPSLADDGFSFRG